MSQASYFSQEWNAIRESYGRYLIPFVLVLCGILILRRLSRKKLNLPPGPRGLPLVGYLPYLGKEPFKTLHTLSKTYGKVFGLYLGHKYTVVLADDSAVKEAFSKPAMNNRPIGMFDFIPDGGGVAGANGEEWVDQRRFLMKSMKDIGLGRTTWTSLVEDEVSDLLKFLKNKKGQSVEVNTLLRDSISNNIASLVFGKRLTPGPEKDSFFQSIEKIFLMFSPSSLLNFFPRLINLFVKLKVGYYYKSYLELKFANTFVRNIVNSTKKLDSDLGETTFIKKYLANIKSDQGKKTFFTERNLHATTLSLFIGGSDTTKISLIWLLLTVATYPEVQKKVQQELDTVLGKNRRATWEDRLSFPYTYRVLLESMRWKTTVPIDIPRMAAADTKFYDYDIPKGTTVLANIWGLHNDTRYWTNPDTFLPERFMQNGKNEVDLKKESFAPFSYGRRKCPGEQVAYIEAFLYFTSILQSFDVRTPNGEKPKMEAILSLTYAPVSQELCFIPRHGISEI